MPLTRYQIRNEYSLADPELYGAADKDDPEALLEGVAMAGLVGVLRQLGDLAEFAAEIFHDLHEEVMATAARGHGLMVRVQQLEAEFPSIEKAFLSQTRHSLFFYNAGVDWHPNLRTDQNLITRGDLPRFVMDSYEECRGPPRLFLLDKFDIAGAGACLKRYTDPSFFKVEAASSRIGKVDVQREKKIRKVKKKGSRWRNGETPEVLPSSHAKLHQLFLEERVENGSNDPARLVKLKKRQLNGSSSDSQTKRSYMEKFLQSPSPEHKVVHEISLSPSPLRLTPNVFSEPGLEILDIQTVSPAKESLSLSPIAQETELLKPSMGEFNEEVIDGGILKMPAPNPDVEVDEIPSTLHQVVSEKERAIDGESKTDGSVDGSPSDDVASEIDNYMDALTTMESEMETDTECRPKNNRCFLNIEKNGTDSDANEEQQHVQAQFLDSQSIGNSNASDDENISCKRGRSSFSHFDTLSNLAENTPSDGDGAAKTESSVGEIVDTSFDQLSINEEIQETKSHEHLVPNNSCTEVVDIPSYRSEFGEASCNSCLTDLNPMLPPLDPGTSSREAMLARPELDETLSNGVKLESGLSDTDQNGTTLGENLPVTTVVSDVRSQTRDDFLLNVSAETYPAVELNDGAPNAFSDALLHLSNNSILASEKNSSDNFVNKVLQAEYADDGSSENLVNGNIDSPHSIISSSEEELLSTTFPEVERCSSISLLPDGLPASIACYPDVEKHDGIVSEVNNAIPEAGVNSGSLTPKVDSPQTQSFSEQKFSEITDDVLPIEPDLAEVSVVYSGEKSNLECSITDSEDADGSMCNVDIVENGATPLRFSSDYPNNQGPEDDVHSDDVVTKTDQAESVAVVSAAGGSDDGNDVICLSPDMICSPSRNFTNMQESLSTSLATSSEGLSPSGNLIESDAQKEVNQWALAPGDLEAILYSTVSCSQSNSKVPSDVPDSSLDEQTQNSLPIGDVTTAPTSSKQNDQDMESESHHQTHLSENSEDAGSSPTCYLQEPGIPFKQALELQVDHLNVENLHLQASPQLSNLQFEQVQAPNHIDQERCFDAPSESSRDNLPSQPSASEFSLQSADLKLNLLPQRSSPTCYLQEPGTPSEQALELQVDHPNVENLHLQASPQLLNLQFEQVQAPNHIDQEGCFDAPSESSRDNFPSEPSASVFSLQSADLKLDLLPQRSSPTSYLQEPGIPFKQALELQVDHLNVENLHLQASPQLSNLQFEQVQAPNHIDQERCFDAPSESSRDNLPSQPSASEFSLQSADLKLNLLPQRSSPTCYLQEPEIPFKQALELQVDHLNVENLHLQASPQLSNLQFEQEQASNHIDQEGCFDAPSESPQDNLPSQPSASEFSLQSADLKLNLLPQRSSPTCYLQEPQIPFKQALELQVDHLNVENLHLQASPQLSNLQFEQVQAPNHIDQERCFDAPSESSRDDLPSQPSASEFSLQSADLKLESSEQATDPSETIFPSFGMLPHASQGNLEEMPPLPPLPPMQWRIGKLQHAPLDSGRELVEHTLGSFPPMLPSSADEKAQFGFPALGGEIQQPQNPFLPLSAVKDEKLQHVSEYLANNLVQPSPLPLQMPTMVDDAYSQHNLFTPEGAQSLNPFLALPAMSEGRPQHGSLALDGERIQPNLSPFSSITTVEDITSRHAPVSLPENLIQPLNHTASETGLEDKKPQHNSVSSGGDKVSHPETFVPPPTMEDDQPQHGLLTHEGEMAWSSNTSDLLPVFEEGKSNGNPSVKLPRPRSPLIDAVAAHDKSKMRKVTERVRPQIGPQVDERDSLLQQIRTKSFNLKPAVVTRPSIQGPKTNLKVAAILEKANAIRQALAGSDEDDDADSWSDS